MKVIKINPFITRRVRLLSCPVEKKESDKIRLINAKAYKDINIAIITYLTPFAFKVLKANRITYRICLTIVSFLTKFKGRPIHTTTMP